MKTIRVFYVDTPHLVENGVIHDAEMQFFHDRLSIYYNVVIDPKTPDFVFGNMYGSEIVKYDAIRISFSGEELAPNFNVYDYAITCFQDFSYRDRVFCWHVPLFDAYTRDVLAHLDTNREFTAGDLAQKTGFCSFVQSHALNADPFRAELFHKLSEYKQVDAGGLLYNNVGGPVPDKVAFEREYKFSISCINGRNYTLQDRPLDAFVAQTLPIYWGNPAIGEIYNTKAFVNCMDYDSVERVVEVVKEIDNDDARYIEMMSEPVYVPGLNVTLESELKRLDDFLIHIVENGSIQRSGVYWNNVFEKSFYYGQKRAMRSDVIAKKIRPITRVAFSSKPGKVVKRAILRQVHKNDHRDAYKGYK